MRIYKDFARYYAIGTYPEFSQAMAELLPAVLEHFNSEPSEILDLGCGEGTFAIIMAKQDYQVTGVDQSKEMLRIAREKAGQKDLPITFLEQDIRSLTFEGQFDLATCWFDSLNYLLELEGLVRAFSGIFRALKVGGLFIFDMNTRHGLEGNWQSQACFIEVDTDEVFVVHKPGYDQERKIAKMQITGFMKQGPSWIRMDEDHFERGYSLEEIRTAFSQTGFQELACWGSFTERSPVKSDSDRVWFVVKKTV